MYWAPKNAIWAFLDFSIFDQKNRLLGLLEGILWEGWSCLWPLALEIGFSKILSYHMVISDVWFGQESISNKIKSVRNKFNFKFSNLLHMFKRHICIGNYMNMVFIVLDYDHVNFFFFAVIIIALVSSESPLCCRPWAELRENGNHSCMILGQPCHSCLLFVVYLEYIKNYIVKHTL